MRGAVASLAGRADALGRSAAEDVEDWFVVDGHRGFVAATALLAAFLAVGALQFFEVAPPVETVTLVYLFAAFTTGNLTLVTLVLSINQLVLSRSMRSPRELRDEVTAAIDYRDEVAQQTYEFVSPDDSSYFLHLLVDSVAHRVEDLRETVDETTDAEVHDALVDVVDTLEAHVEDMNAAIQEPETDAFQSLTAILRHDVGEQINRCRLVQHRFGHALDERTDETLGAIQTRLELLEIARQYFMTIYLNEELAQFSRAILYVGFPAVVASVSMLVLLSDVTAASLTANWMSPVVLLAIVLELAPLAVLVSYVLRISTLAELSSAIPPFTTTG